MCFLGNHTTVLGEAEPGTVSGPRNTRTLWVHVAGPSLGPPVLKAPSGNQVWKYPNRLRTSV